MNEEGTGRGGDREAVIRDGGDPMARLPYCRSALWGQSLLTLPLLAIMVLAGTRLRVSPLPLLVLFTDNARLRGALSQGGAGASYDSQAMDIVAAKRRPRICVITDSGRNIYFKPLRVLLLNFHTFTGHFDARALMRFIQEQCD